MFALFGFVEAAKFRDSGEFSDCVQNVGGKVTTTRSYFSEGNSVSFPERYPKSENGWDFDILCMRSPWGWRDLCKFVALRALIRSVARTYAL